MAVFLDSGLAGAMGGDSGDVLIVSGCYGVSPSAPWADWNRRRGSDAGFRRGEGCVNEARARMTRPGKGFNEESRGRIIHQDSPASRLLQIRFHRHRRLMRHSAAPLQPNAMRDLAHEYTSRRQAYGRQARICTNASLRSLSSLRLLTSVRPDSRVAPVCDWRIAGHRPAPLLVAALLRQHSAVRSTHRRSAARSFFQRPRRSAIAASAPAVFGAYKESGVPR